VQPGEAVAGGLDAENLDVAVVEEGVEQADGVRAAADRRDSESGRRPSAQDICSRVSRPMTDWKSRTIAG
jgi:hypothetical protein